MPDERETVVTGAPVGPPPARRRWFDDNLALGLGMLLLLLLLVAGAAGGIYWARHHNGHRSAATVSTVVVTTTKTPAHKALAMPPLVGLTQQQAVARLRSMHLTATIVMQPSAKPRGTVISERPGAASAVTAGTPVTIAVSSGVSQVAVPSFVGQPIAQARATAASMHFRVATTPVTGAGKPAGTVVDQAPKAGKKLAKGGLVTLSVAKGKSTTTTGATTTGATTTTAAATPRTATVPDVSGQDEQAAVQSFAQAGVLPSLVFVSSSDPEGTVEAQAKPGGTTVPYRSHVQINISSGQSPTMEHMPNVVGMTLEQALASINGTHLKMIYVKLAAPRSQAGKIVQQSPLAGGAAPENGQVLVFLGVYRP